MGTSWAPFPEPGPRVTEADVRRFEREFGHELPADYRAFLLEVNGGRPPRSHRVFRLRRRARQDESGRPWRPRSARSRSACARGRVAAMAAVAIIPATIRATRSFARRLARTGGIQRAAACPGGIRPSGKCA